MSVGYDAPMFIRAVRSLWILLLPCLLLIAVGCGTPTRTVQVTVVNEADAPIVAWLAKEGLPYEMGWLTPAQFAIMYNSQPPDREEVPAVVIEPGERAGIGPRTGKFKRDAVPVLHIYSTPVTLAEMAATERRSGLRDVIPLNEGENFVTVTSTMPVRARLLRPRAAEEGISVLGSDNGADQ